MRNPGNAPEMPWLMAIPRMMAKLQRYACGNSPDTRRVRSLGRHGLRVALGLTAISALAQDALPAHPADPQISAAVRQISASRIQSNIEKLVSFQTRSTLSAQDAASITSGHGIGAAREWIKSEFERYSRDCGGCLEVKLDGFTEVPGGRIPKPTEITNVYAVLKGSDPASSGRIVLVTGHYDSRNSENLKSRTPLRAQTTMPAARP